MSSKAKILDSVEIFFVSLKVAALGAILFVCGHFVSERLPPPSELVSAIAAEPLQEPLASSVAPLQKIIKNHEYKIYPKANYHIYGLVVEQHDSFGWSDITHSQAGDFINTKDLCLIWGANSVSPYLKDMHFSHGDWTCYYQTKSSAAWAQFKQNQVSNNHILPATPELAKTLDSLRIGDQIEIQGQLVDYSTDDQPLRKTSLTRDDTGNGACEIIYASNIKLLSRTTAKWARLEKIGKYLFAASILVGLGFLFFGKKEDESN